MAQQQGGAAAATAAGSLSLQLDRLHLRSATVQRLAAGAIVQSLAAHRGWDTRPGRAALDACLTHDSRVRAPAAPLAPRHPINIK